MECEFPSQKFVASGCGWESARRAKEMEGGREGRRGLYSVWRLLFSEKRQILKLWESTGEGRGYGVKCSDAVLMSGTLTCLCVANFISGTSITR